MIDTILYTLTAKNVGDGLMTQPVITDPIPAGTVYLPFTAAGEDCEIVYSVDGGKEYQDWPPMIRKRNAKGRRIKVEAMPHEISHVRWNILKNLEPGDSHEMELQVVVQP